MIRPSGRSVISTYRWKTMFCLSFRHMIYIKIGLNFILFATLYTNTFLHRRSKCKWGLAENLTVDQNKE